MTSNSVIQALETEIAYLRTLENPTGYVHVAIGGVQTAIDNLHYHEAALARTAAAATPAPAEPAPQL